MLLGNKSISAGLKKRMIQGQIRSYRQVSDLISVLLLFVIPESE